MPLSTAAADHALDLLGNTYALYLSVHTADPGSTGANETTGGSPAYVRQLVPWASAASALKGISVAISVPVPAGTYTHWGLWDAVAGGEWQGGEQLGTARTFTGQGILQFTAASLGFA